MAVIDLSQLPAPQIVDVPDFETLLAERKAQFVALHPKDEREAVIRTLELESEPVTKLLQENAYRELLLRQRINEAAQAVMVAYGCKRDDDRDPPHLQSGTDCTGSCRDGPGRSHCHVG